MSDENLRQILNEVISDIDEGRIAHRRQPLTARGSRFLARVITPGAVALSLTLGGGCYMLYASPPSHYDAHVHATVDAGPDSGPSEDADLDSGPDATYMCPPVDADLDAEPSEDASPPPDPEND